MERSRILSLREGSELRVERPLTHIAMDLVTHPLPAGHVSAQAEFFCVVDGPIERHPCHDLGIGEVLASAAQFPNAFVRFLPYLGKMIGQRALQRGIGCARSDSAKMRMQQCIGDFAVYVELQLLRSCIPNPDRS